MHTPQSVLRVVDKLASGGVVMMLSALLSTLAAHLTGLATHSKSNWERMEFPVHSDGIPVQAYFTITDTPLYPSRVRPLLRHTMWEPYTCTLTGSEGSPLTAASADPTSPPWVSISVAPSSLTLNAGQSTWALAKERTKIRIKPTGNLDSSSIILFLVALRC